MHPLRCLHEPLPCLRSDRRSCLRLGFFRPDRLGTDASLIGVRMPRSDQGFDRCGRSKRCAR